MPLSDPCGRISLLLEFLSRVLKNIVWRTILVLLGGNSWSIVRQWVHVWKSDWLVNLRWLSLAQWIWAIRLSILVKFEAVNFLRWFESMVSHIYVLLQRRFDKYVFDLLRIFSVAGLHTQRFHLLPLLEVCIFVADL